jgi:TatA/E family protein of Tat protein translocase
VFGISGTELVLIAVFALIIFGPDKIPEIARTVNKAVSTFKRVQEDTERLIKAEMLGANEKSSAPAAGTAADTTASPSVASTLYGGNDDDDEEEEE